MPDLQIMGFSLTCCKLTQSGMAFGVLGQPVILLASLSVSLPPVHMICGSKQVATISSVCLHLEQVSRQPRREPETELAGKLALTIRSPKPHWRKHGTLVNQAQRTHHQTATHDSTHMQKLGGCHRGQVLTGDGGG
jgi:hypothetical protein